MQPSNGAESTKQSRRLVAGKNITSVRVLVWLLLLPCLLRVASDRSIFQTHTVPSSDDAWSAHHGSRDAMDDNKSLTEIVRFGPGLPSRLNKLPSSLLLTLLRTRLPVPVTQIYTRSKRNKRS
jgi:hypothetical protein